MSASPAKHELGDLPLEEFTRQADALARWIAEYLGSPERYPVLSRVAPGDLGRALPATLPDQAESFEQILADFERIVMPGVTHWNHPGFFAYFANTASVPGILGELVTAALNQVGILWRTSPALAELEQTTTAWLRDAMRLPRDWFGMITDTASTSTLQALAAARERDPALGIRERGLAGRSDVPVLRVYCSDQAHSSVDKAVITLGLGRENCVRVPSDEQFRMRSDALAAQVAADVAAGMRPLAVVATLGTTSSTAVDPIAEIAELCERHGMWLHADAAYGGVLALLPERQAMFAGLERADSLVVNAHKWLFTPMDCSVLWTRHPDVLRRAFSLTPEYLRTPEQDVALSYSDYSFQLGRRFRALKLWFVLRAFGLEGIQARLRHHCALADAFAARVRAADRWELLAPVGMSVVCFRHRPDGLDEAALAAHNAAILERVNASGRVFISHTALAGRYALRVAIGNLRSTQQHLDDAWTLLEQAANA
jgi:aromatic-L-amino-acid/L-tryptophan decarboxylase